MPKVLQYQRLAEPIIVLPVLVQAADGVPSGSSISISLTGVVKGNAIVVMTSVFSALAGVVVLVSDDKGDTFVCSGNTEDGSFNARSDVWTSFNSSGGTTNVTINFGVSVSAQVVVAEVANIVQDVIQGTSFFAFSEGANDETVAVTNHQCASSPNAINTSPAGSIVFGVGTMGASDISSILPGTNYNVVKNFYLQSIFQYRISSVVLTGEVGPFTSPDALKNSSVLVSFRTGSAGGTANPYSAAMQPQPSYQPPSPSSRFRHHEAYFAPVTTPAAAGGPTVAQIMAALQPQLDTQWQKRYPPYFVESRPVMPTPWWRWQSAGINSAAGVASQALSLPNASTSGRAIIVGVAFYNNATATMAVTDDKGNSYSQIGSYQTSGLGRIGIFACFNITGSATPVITATPSVSCFVTMEAGEYSGLAQTSQPDGTNGATGSSTSPDTGSIPVNSANELMLSFVSQVTNTSSSLVSNSGSTGLYLNPTAPMPMGVAEQNASTATDGLFTFGGSVAWLTVGASFKLTPSGSTPSVAQMMAAMQPQWLPVPPKPKFIGSDGSVAPIEPTLYVKQKLDWYVQHPTPIVYKQPMAQTLYVQPLVPIAALALLADTSVVSATILVSMAVNPTIIVSMAVNPDT